MNKVISIIVLAACSIFPKNSSSQNTESIINDIDIQLKKGQTTVTKVLTSDSLMYLHSITAFREVIRKNAKAEKVAIVSDQEPGVRVTVSGLVIDNKGLPIRDVLIYFYQTSDKGWYSDTAAHILVIEGDLKHARLFGYLKTDSKGQFSFETIKPKGYPNSDLAAHIHIHLWSGSLETLHGPGELQFEDDPRMAKARKERSLRKGFLISKNTGTAQKPLYEYRIVVA